MRRILVLGLDLGGTKIAAGVVTSSGRLLSSIRVPTPASGVKQDLARIFDAAQSAVAAAERGWKAIRAVGVGVPGAFDPESETVWAPNLPGWKKAPLKRLLGKAFRRPVFIEGDRNVQALAEAWLGGHSKRLAQNLVFLTVGTGIGPGIIADGRLIAGAHGTAGAAGWPAVSDRWRAEFGRKGCLESQAAGPAVPRTRDHRTTRRALEEAGQKLGRGVASIVSLLNPELVVVGGGLANAGERLLGPLRRAAKKWGQPLALRQVRIVRSKLGENAGILGAARYALMKLEGN